MPRGIGGIANHYVLVSRDTVMQNNVGILGAVTLRVIEIPQKILEQMHPVEERDIDRSIENLLRIALFEEVVAANLKELTGRLIAKHVG